MNEMPRTLYFNGIDLTNKTLYRHQIDLHLSNGEYLGHINLLNESDKLLNDNVNIINGLNYNFYNSNIYHINFSLQHQLFMGDTKVNIVFTILNNNLSILYNDRLIYNNNITNNIMLTITDQCYLDNVVD